MFTRFSQLPPTLVTRQTTTDPRRQTVLKLHNQLDENVLSGCQARAKAHQLSSLERTKQYQHGEGVGSLLADTRYFRLDALHATSCPNYLNTTTEMEIRRQAASLVSLRISRHSASRSTPLPHLQQIPVGFASYFTLFRKSLRQILRYGCCNQA